MRCLCQAIKLGVIIENVSKSPWPDLCCAVLCCANEHVLSYNEVSDPAEDEVTQWSPSIDLSSTCVWDHRAPEFKFITMRVIIRPPNTWNVEDVVWPFYIFTWLINLTLCKNSLILIETCLGSCHKFTSCLKKDMPRLIKILFHFIFFSTLKLYSHFIALSYCSL